MSQTCHGVQTMSKIFFPRISAKTFAIAASEAPSVDRRPEDEDDVSTRVQRRFERARREAINANEASADTNGGGRTVACKIALHKKNVKLRKMF